MKKVVLLAIVLLMSGLSFAQTKQQLPDPFSGDYKEDGYSVNQAVNFFSKNKNSVQAESLRETFLNIPAIKTYFPNLSVNDAIYLLSCCIKRMGHFEKGEYKINGIRDGKVVLCDDRCSWVVRKDRLPGDEPWMVFGVTEVLKDSFKITIASVPPVPVVLARCLNTLTLNVVDVPKKPIPEMPVVQQAPTQQMSHDTTIVNVIVEIPENFGNSNNVIQDDGASTVVIGNQDYYNNNANYYYQDNYSTPVRNLNAFMTANANVEGQCGAYDGNMWGNNYGYSNNQDYYNNANYSNTASWGNPSAGAYFAITGTATTVPVTYDPNVYYYGHLRQANNNNNGGRVVQQRRGTNQKQNN